MTALSFLALPLHGSASQPARAWPGGTPRSALQSALFAALMASGLVLEWGPRGGAALLVAHVGAGLALLALALPWLAGHVRNAPAKSGRALFTWLGWALLVKYLTVLATGLLMTLPAALWLAGQVWFWPLATTRLLVFLHLWLSFAAFGGLALHLGLRHWRAS